MPVLPACFYPLRPGRSPSHYWLPVGRERNASTRQHQVRTSLCFRTCTPCSVHPWIITFLDSGARAVVVCMSRHRTLRRRHTGRFTSNAFKLRETTRTPSARTSAIPSKARMLVVIALLQRLVSVYSGSSLRILSEWINTMPQSGAVLLLTFFSLAVVQCSSIAFPNAVKFFLVLDPGPHQTRQEEPVPRGVFVYSDGRAGRGGDIYTN